MQLLGVKEITLHTSGHASAEDIEVLKQTVNPKSTVFVHTEAPQS
ncbi:MAG: MBL fold metallo-hydrolase RNA specificity domain-containing protein [Candidatus Coproplasma sp.]